MSSGQQLVGALIFVPALAWLILQIQLWSSFEFVSAIPSILLLFIGVVWLAFIKISSKLGQLSALVGYLVICIPSGFMILLLASCANGDCL